MAKLTRLVLFAVALALVSSLGACGDDDEGGDGVAAGSDATVSVASTSLGDVLVDADGRTLYLFTKDTGDASSCTDACAATWPTLRIDGEPVAGEGVDGAKLATTGEGQVTYAGRLLYRFGQDAAPGDVKGQGVGGVWFVVDRDGQPVESSAASSTTGATVQVPSY